MTFLAIIEALLSAFRYGISLSTIVLMVVSGLSSFLIEIMTGFLLASIIFGGCSFPRKFLRETFFSEFSLRRDYGG